MIAVRSRSARAEVRTRYREHKSPARAGLLLFRNDRVLVLPDLYQLFFMRSGGGLVHGWADVLRSSPMIDIRDLVDATHRAVRCARFCSVELPHHIGLGVICQRFARISALLRTVVHQPVLAYIEIAGAGAAAPVIRLAVGDVFLEVIEL